MPDLDEQLQQAVDEAAGAFARIWFGKAHEIAEKVEKPEQRWAILVAALRQIGWPR